MVAQDEDTIDQIIRSENQDLQGVPLAEVKKVTVDGLVNYFFIYSNSQKTWTFSVNTFTDGRI